MDEKVNKQLQQVKNELKKHRKEYIDVFNLTHQKIEIGDEQLFNMIVEQRKTIEALITILVSSNIIKDSTIVGDIINAKEVMDKITYIEPTEQEIKSFLQAEADILYKLLYRSKKEDI